MSKRLVKYPLENGQFILVEIDEPDEAGTVRVGRVGDKIEEAKETLEQALGNLEPVAKAVINKIRGLVDAPDEISVEFGLKLAGNAGVILASASVEANYKVSLKWKKE